MAEEEGVEEEGQEGRTALGSLVLPDSAALSESSSAAEDDELTQVHAMGPIVEPSTAAAASSSSSRSSSSNCAPLAVQRRR